MDNWSLNDWHYVTMWLRATITFEMWLSVSPSHYNKFRYHTAVGAIKAALHGQKLKLLIWGIASTAESACIEWRMLYKSPCKTALKAEMSLPAFTGMSEDDFHRSQSIALRENHHFTFHRKCILPTITINFNVLSMVESHQTDKEKLLRVCLSFLP